MTHSLSRTAYTEALNELDNKRIKCVKPLIPPQILMEDIPLTLRAAQTILEGRVASENVIKGQDDRLLAVVGPCSIHDVKSAKEYATRLLAYANRAKDDLLIIMRVYFEKPRTTVGWKKLINDPFLGNRYGQNLSHKNEMGLPTGCEFLDNISPQYTGDLVSWGAIGARTTESQVHRELASGLSCAVGFKNGTDGSVTVAMDAIKAASNGHHFLSVTKQGLSAIVETEGNNACHIILRGGQLGPNYEAEQVKQTARALERAKLPSRIMVDCSHGNSNKDHKRQSVVALSVAQQLARPRATGDNIVGVMIESHLVEGRQDIPAEGAHRLTYGQSITDACISWEDTVKVLDELREGVRARRVARLAI
ncbi:3-deoxy-7-phosphoheptulonate synthase [Zychaea mexicana]|uniref:3-deoxy-7-phosphoheptulonate synthase n=1 Tax=Zychaea mexicana TaxID=64656 RepID=UPI0022FE2EAD|nr:3-deoxy-7-phosphoheptulonate synthase [Zychaea mexicana]KAI9489810.1 3-deoxy-7-phosphoheptulonate synthase [Zychaea mexicana]